MRAASARRAPRGVERLSIAGLVLALLLVAMPAPAAASGVVGTGTPQSCNNAALDQRLAGGGAITFNCGPGPVTIVISQKTIATNTTINGGNRVTLSGNSATRLFVVNKGKSLTLQNITLAGGNAGPTENGGAVLNKGGSLTMANVTTLSNSAERGGTIASVGGTVTISSSTLVQGIAGIDGGHLHLTLGATLTMKDSTLATGIANSGKGGHLNLIDSDATLSSSTLVGGVAGAGGAAYLDGGSLNLYNSTVSGNRATISGGSDGGGLATIAGTVALNHVTLAFNTASDRGGGLLVIGTGQAHVANSILSDNTAPSGPDCASSGTGGVVSHGYNLLKDVTECAIGGDQTGLIISPHAQLMPLSKSGGPTMTHPTNVNSAARGVANPVVSSAPEDMVCLATDQRGVARPQQGRCDLGAHEQRVTTLDDVFVEPSTCTAADFTAAMASADIILFRCRDDNTFTIAEQVVSRTIGIFGSSSADVVLSGGDTNRLFHVQSGAHLYLSNMHLANGNANGDGGAILNTGRLSLFGTRIRDSHATGRGGAVANTSTAAVSFGTELHDNSASFGGALAQISGTLTSDRIWVHGNEATRDGAGMYVAGGTVTLKSSTLEVNTAPAGDGGGLAVAGGTVTIENSTFASNVAGSGGGTNSAGGGIAHLGGTLKINHVTIGLNQTFGSSGVGSGGLEVGSSGGVELANSVLFDNLRNGAASDCRATATNPLHRRGYVLLETLSGCITDGNGTGFLTGEAGTFVQLPARYIITSLISGPVYRPTPGNRVIEAGNPATPDSGPWTCLAFDQRSVRRPQQSRCDIGAVELDQLPPSSTHTLTPSANAAGWNNTNATLTITATDQQQASGIDRIEVVLAGAEQATLTIQSSRGSIVIDTEGITTVTYHAVDRDGNVEPQQHTVEIKLDKTTPVTTAPTLELETNVSVNNTSLPVRVRWTGTETLSGIQSYQLQQSLNGGAFGNVPRGSATSTSVLRQLTFGSSYSYRVRGKDVAGNLGAFSQGTTMTTAYSEESAAAVTYAGSWNTQSLTSAHGGELRHANTAGATATFTFSGQSVAWVAPCGPSRGLAEVRIDGDLIATVDLYCPSALARRVVFAHNGLALGSHTLEVRVLGTRNDDSTGNRVDIDGFVVLS